MMRGAVLVACVWVAACASSLSCSEQLSGEDAVAWAQSLTTKQLGEMVRKGDLECAAKVGALVDAKGAATLASEAEMALRGVDRQARGVREALRTSDGASEGEVASGDQHAIVPAFEWAQSASHAFLRIKWAHKIDAPATLDVSKPRVVATNGATTRVLRWDFRL